MALQNYNNSEWRADCNKGQFGDNAQFPLPTIYCSVATPPATKQLRWARRGVGIDAVHMVMLPPSAGAALAIASVVALTLTH